MAPLIVTHWIQSLIEWVRGEGAAGLIVYAIAFVAITLSLLPTIELYIAAGLIWGVGWGTAITTVLTLVAALAAYVLVHSPLRPRIEKRLRKHKKLAAFDRGITARSFWISFLLRVSPIVPFGALNYALAATKISLVTYLVTTLLGMLPTNVLFAYAGSLLHSATELGNAQPDGIWRHVLLWGGIAASIGASVLVGLAAKRALAHAQAS